MAVIKQTSIYSNPKKMLVYILNINKTQEELVSGINTLPTLDYANNIIQSIL